MRQQFAILGAGIIGLLTAYRLLARGHDVLLVDRAAPGREASWAGGGIVSPLYPWRYGDAVTALAAGATDAHRELAADLRRQTGIDPQFNDCGLLMLDPQETDAALTWCRRNHRRVIRCTPADMPYIQPGLGAASDGLWFPEIGNVRNPRLLHALIAAVSMHPRAICRWHAQVALHPQNAGQLEIDGRRHDVDRIIVAAGAWSADLLKPFAITLPITPVRGQMLLYPPQPGLLRSIVLRAGRYLIPRRDGRIVAGSTLEYAGFERAITTEAREQLQTSAARMLPALAAAEPELQWAGLRPGSPDGIPFIDAIPGTRVFVNAGHFRNGLVLAPAAVDLGVALLLEETPAVNPVPYRLDAYRNSAFV